MKIKHIMFRNTTAFILYLVFFSCIFLGNTRHVEGQTYQTFQSELNQIVETTRWRIGPFRIIPRIDLQLLRHERNIFYQSDEEEPASDFTSRISPEINVYLLIKDKVIFQLTERPTYVHYYRYKQERRFDHNFIPVFKLLLLNRFVLIGSYTWRSHRYRPTSEFNIRANEYYERMSGSLFYETARQTSLGISFSQDKIAYDDITFPGQETALSRIFNRKNRVVEAEFNYHVFSSSFFFFTASYGDHDFAYTEEFDRRSHTIQGLTGIRFPLIGGITGTLAIGLKRIKPRASGLEGKTGLIGNTSLSFKSGRLGANISYNRDFPFSFWENNVYFIDNRYGVGANFYVTQYLRLDYSYSFGNSKYPELIPLYFPDGTFENIRREDSYHTHTLGFFIRIFKQVGLGISTHQWMRNSNYLGENRRQFYVDASLTFDF